MLNALQNPVFESDTVVFGLLMLALAAIFYTSSIDRGFWKQFYRFVPVLLLCYLIPAVFTSLGLIDDDVSQLYYVASRYLLPAALVLMTLSIDLKAIYNLGPKALILFFAGTLGIVLGGPLALLLVSWIAPELLGGAGPDAIWRGLSTIAGSWIGGGANQAAMLEIYKYNPDKYGGMVLVDIVVANIWMAIILLGIEKNKRIDRWLQADTSAIEALKEKVSAFAKSITRTPTLTDYMIMLGLAFGAVGLSHWFAEAIASFLNERVAAIQEPGSPLASFSSTFFWMVTMATAIGIVLSYTPARNLEGAGASKIGGIFIYILVATIGMKMDLTQIFENPALIVIGLVWMTFHALLLIGVAKWIKAPFFFLAVGSQANVGGAASAPVIAAAFHPSLATVGVLLAVLGYVVGTYGAILCTILMQMVTQG
ncbi:DUF819 family protein [Croceiramulus getboli]|nr:DUF819 family protein [Flavobacteriaceae bacterium YJPT1-3]